jgi:hypothetical protein
MPTITEAPISAWAHCSDVGCPASAQEPVEGIHRLVAETIGERGGDGIFASLVEKSTPYVLFANPDDAVCPECGGPREITDQKRESHGTAFGGPAALLRLREIGAPTATRDSLLAAAQDAGRRPATAREQLDEAYVLGRIDEPEYQRKRAMLEGVSLPEAATRSRTNKKIED